LDLKKTLAILDGKRDVKELFDTIVLTEVCSGCAACVLACPVDALDYEPDRPLILEHCIDCQLCYRACPRMEYNVPQIETLMYPYGIERQHSDAYADYLYIIAARSIDPKILDIGQDGGVVTALLNWMMAKGMIEGAMVARRFEDWSAKATLVTSKEELMNNTSGSLYTYVPNPLAAKEAKERGLEKVAFVGTPCEISGIRQLQTAKSKRSREMVKAINLTIGLLCSETFTYEGFVKQIIEGELGLNLRDIKKINIKGKILIYLKNGEVISVSLKQAKRFMREGCKFCQDFSGEHADLSMGGLGLDGWTITIVRTPRGKEVFEQAVAEGILETRPAEDFPTALDLLVRLAIKQKERPTRATPSLFSEWAATAAS